VCARIFVVELKYSQLIIIINHLNNMPSTMAAGGGIYSGVFDKDVKVPDQSRSRGGAHWYLFFQYPETILLDHTSCWSIRCCSFCQFCSVHLSTAPRFTEPGSLSITMVHDMVQPSFLLRPVARTIPPLRGHSLVFHHFPHHSYFNIYVVRFPLVFHHSQYIQIKIPATKEN
jgi:hypothetical protein